MADQVSDNFKRDEFACKCGCGFDTVDAVTLEVIEDVRSHFGVPVSVTSASRCQTHNRSVGGADASFHLKGRAVDIKVGGVSPCDVYAYLESKYPERYGFGRYSTFVHVDTRSNGAARWIK